MKLLRHILSHLFLISLLIAVASVFYYRTLLLPGHVVEKVDVFVKDVYPPALSFVSKRDYFWSIKGERIVSFDDLNFFEKADEASKVVAKTEAVKEEKPSTVIVDADPVKPKVTQKVDKDEVKEKVVVAQIDSAEVETKDKKIEVIKATASPVAETEIPVANDSEVLPVEVKDSDTSSERDLLISARNAFNNGKLIQSEKLYLELTQMEQDNPDAFGELGNVYYSQGKWDEAGQAYYEAAVRLISKGKRNQVVYLQRVITGLNTEHAEKLSRLMMSQ